MAPAPHVVYSQELSQALRRGHPIANPQPVDYQYGHSNIGNGSSLRPVEIGDVGYIQPEHGFFIRIFNIHLEPGEDGQSCRDDLPDEFAPLPKGTVSKTTDTTPVFLSQSVTSIGLDATVSGPFLGASAGFSASTKRGAILATPDPITCYNAIHILNYKIYAKDNIKYWHEFARRRGHDVTVEDLILVTGVDYTTSWATAVWTDTKLQVGFGLQVQFANMGDGLQLACHYSWQRTSGALVNSGPARTPSATVSQTTSVGQGRTCRTTTHMSGENTLPQPMNTVSNQSLFIRHIRAKRRLPWPGLRIAARGEKDDDEPNDSDDSSESDSASTFAATGNADDIRVSRFPGPAKVASCLETVLDHILMNSDSDIAIAHDEDLAFLLDSSLPNGVVPIVQNSVGLFIHGPPVQPPEPATAAQSSRDVDDDENDDDTHNMDDDNSEYTDRRSAQDEESAATAAPGLASVALRMMAAALSSSVGEYPQYPHYTNAPALTGGWNPQSNSYASSSTHQFPDRFQTPHLSTTSSVAGTSHGSSFAERGYIANMFGPALRTYWGSVLKASPEHLHLQTIPGPSPYWRISPQDHSAGIQNAGHALDYILDVDYVAGPVVPQQLWQPLYKHIREVLVENSRLCMPIFFIVQETGRVGLSLSEALAKKHYLLHGHNQAVDLGGKVTTHIRILWKGYMEYKRQIQIQDQTRDRNPITLGRLVEHVARTVQRFIERPPQRNEDDFDPRWTVGPHGITINDIVLVGIVHSSAGTWQPILRLSRPLPQLAQAFASPVNQQALHSNTYIQPPSPEFSFDYPGDNYHYSGHAPSPEQFTTITHTPSPPHHQYPSSYPSSPNLQVLSTDGMYLAPSPPYSAYPST